MLSVTGSSFASGNVYMLEEQPPVQIPASLSTEKVKQAIIKGMSFRGWKPVEEKPGEIIAKIHVRTHMVKVSIKYDDKKIQISYLDSINMGYVIKEIDEDENYSGIEGAVPHINMAYIGWTKNLATDIKTAMRYHMNNEL